MLLIWHRWGEDQPPVLISKASWRRPAKTTPPARPGVPISCLP